MRSHTCCSCTWWTWEHSDLNVNWACQKSEIISEHVKHMICMVQTTWCACTCQHSSKWCRQQQSLKMELWQWLEFGMKNEVDVLHTQCHDLCFDMACLPLPITFIGLHSSTASDLTLFVWMFVWQESKTWFSVLPGVCGRYSLCWSCRSCSWCCERYIEWIRCHRLRWR